MADNNEEMQSISTSGETWFLDDRIKSMLLDLQRHWLMHYENSREKALVQMTETLHREFTAEQEQMKNDLVVQFKRELDETRQDLERKHQETLEQELSQVSERYQAEIQACKRKQWCINCSSEAIYHCCWNNSYCSTDCQQRHWPSHRRQCRRRGNNNRNQ
ncbi:hypothetical protein M3Y94_00563800 [Aphelenchoides besseyi]|nr:hypothetical protein M3Y94_00563800 [Aphelenchoides besseyi]